MKALHRRVLQLREREKTYQEICQETNLSKSTVSYILAKYFPTVKNQNISARNRRAYTQSAEFLATQEKRHAAARRGYKKNHEILKANYLSTLREYSDQNFIYYISGLYEGEGSHKGSSFDFCNSDPDLIRPFLRFLRETLDFPDDKFTLRLSLHSSLPKKECAAFWEEICGRKVDFTYQHDSRPQKKVHRHNKDKEFYGTLTVRVKRPNGLKAALKEYTY